MTRWPAFKNTAPKAGANKESTSATAGDTSKIPAKGMTSLLSKIA